MDRKGIAVAIVVAIIVILALFIVIQPKWTVDVEVVGGGSADPSSVEVRDGDSVDIVFAADPGWQLEGVWLDGVQVVSDGDVLTISDIHGDHKVRAVFVQVGMKLTVTSEGNGRTDPSGESYHDEGAEVPLRIVPDEGYVIDGITVDGNPVGSVNLYRVVMDSDHAVEVTFREASDGTETQPADPVVDIDVDVRVETIGYDFGTVDPSGKVRVAYGGSLTVVVELNDGFTLTSVEVDGEDIGADREFTISDIVSDVSVSITVSHRVAVVMHTVTSSASYGGTITPSGETLVEHGGSITFSINPISGWRLSHLDVDGRFAGTGLTEYTLQNVTKDTAVRAVFERIPVTPSGITGDVAVYLERIEGNMVDDGAVRDIVPEDYTTGRITDSEVDLFLLDNMVPGISQTATVKVGNQTNGTIDVKLVLKGLSSTSEGYLELADSITISTDGVERGTLRDLMRSGWSEGLGTLPSRGTDTFTVTLTLSEDAGNAAMGKDLKFVLSVEAYQAGGP